MTYIDHYMSPLGPVTMASDGKALIGLWFDGQKYFGSTLRGFVCPGGQSGNREEKELPVFQQARRWLDFYFQGKQPDFTPPLRFETTPFRRAVWELLLTIPYGQTVTYGEIADSIAARQGIARMSAQAVGGAVGHNPISIIVPCHRVMGKNENLTGYAGGIDKKAALLCLERKTGRDLLSFQHKFELVC